MKRTDTPSNFIPSHLFSFDQWLAGRNLTRTTGYRYRKRGLITTINIFGRLYITLKEIERFERLAINGEFCKEAKTPNRHASKANATPLVSPLTYGLKSGEKGGAE